MTERNLSCADVEDLAAELALGAVSGAERAAAVAHLAGCEACRRLVDDLAATADSLLLLAPAAEPPPGFESRVLSRIAAASQPVPLRSPRRRRVWLAAAAVAAVACLSAAGVAELRPGSGTSTPAPVASGPVAVRTALVSDDAGRWTCRMLVYGDDPTWLVVSLDRNDGLNASFSVEAVTNDSPDAVPVGTLTITDGHGSLTTTVGVPAQQFQSVRVLDQSDHVRYQAAFPARA